MTAFIQGPRFLPATPVNRKYRTNQMPKFLLCASFRGIIAVASLLAVPAIAVAQHSTHGHAGPFDAPGTGPGGQLMAQALPQPATPAVPGMTMGQGDMHAPVVITLRSGIAAGRMVYIGMGGDIDEQVNPTLQVHEGETVQINLINGEGAEHD